MLRDLLIRQITIEGPIPFEVFQRAALYHAEFGFYARGPVRSTRGADFVTSPEVSSMFGQTVANFVSSEMAHLDQPVVVEVGAGSGSLIGPLTEGCPEDVRIIAVEHSAPAREALASIAGIEVVADFPDLSPAGAVVVGNEVVDNIPVALVVRTTDGWMERLVGVVGDGLTFVQAEPRKHVRQWADRYGAGLPVGAMLEVQLEAAAWFGGVLDQVGRGAVVLFDYGGLTEELETRRLSGTLRTYRNHRSGPDPLVDPGAADITTDVDFAALRDVALERGWHVRVDRQDDFLRTWGLQERLTAMRQRELAAARSGDAMVRLQLRSKIQDIEALLNPRGMGDFRVLIARSGTQPARSSVQ